MKGTEENSETAWEQRTLRERERERKTGRERVRERERQHQAEERRVRPVELDSY